MNKQIIKFIMRKQLFYRPIYTLNLVELESLKINIETYLKTRFIQSFKFYADTFIFFNKKSNNSLCLYINYQSPNNLIIKNLYPFFLISKSFDWLGQAKWFT